MTLNFDPQTARLPDVSGGAFDPETATPVRKRTLAAIANDTAIEVANAAAGGVSSAANFVRPGNAFSNWIDQNIVQPGEASQSDAVKAEKQRLQQDIANADGMMGELGAVGRYVVNNPVLAGAQAVGSFVAPGAAVKGGRTLASIAGLNAARGGLAGGAAAGAALAGGDAANTAYDLSTKAGATDEQALAAGRQASVVPAVIGGLGGVVGAERLVAGAKGFAGNALSRAAKTAAVEGAQEGIEEGVTQYEGQRAAMPYDKTIDPSKGVAAAAGMGAALGAATGGGVSLLTGGHGHGQGEQTVPAAAPAAETAPAPTQPAAPAIDPNDGPLSKAASMAGDLGLVPQPAPPTAQEQRGALEAAVARLPEAQQREARINLADVDNQSLPAGVRAMRDARLQELVDGAPPAPVELTPHDMERGRVLQNFDARQPDLPPLADYAPLIEQAIKPEYRAEYQDLLATATDAARSPAERDAAAEVLHATFSPDQLQRARTVRPAPDTRLELQDQNPARFDNGIDFTPTPSTNPAPDSMAERINQLALDADLTPGAPLQLNQAHALRRRAAEAGIPVSVVPHPSGRGYDVAPTVRLDPAARVATPQNEAAAQLPFDQSPSGRMLVGQDGGVRAETRPEAVALSNAAAAQRQQVEAERRRRTELGLSNITPITPLPQGSASSAAPLTFDNAPTGRMVAGADGVRQEGRAEVVNRANAPAPAPQTVTSASGAPFATRQAAQQELQRQQLASTHEVAPAAGDASLGFVLRQRGADQTPAVGAPGQTATNPMGNRAPNWRTNAMQANQVARGLGIETKGKRLAQVVAEIDARDVQGLRPAENTADLSTAQQQREDFRAAEAKRTAPGARARSAAFDANPFKAFIAKHGITLDQRREFAPGTAEQRQAMVPGYGPIFRKTGKRLDLLAQAAVDEGFLATPDEAQLYDMVGRALRGERIVAQYTPDAAETEMQNRIARQRQMEEDAASAVGELSDAALFDLSDEDIVLTADSNTSTADFLRALGATDQEIEDAIAIERAAAQAGDQGRARAQEADAGPAQGSAGQGTQEARPRSVARQDLLGDAPSQSQQAAARERARRQQQEGAQRNAAPGPEDFSLGMVDANTGREVAPGQGSIFGAQQQAASTAPTTTQNAPELVAAGADESSAGGASSPSQEGGHQQDEAPRTGPRRQNRPETTAALEQQALAAIESGANPPSAGPAVARAPAPRSTTRIEDFGETLHGARKMLYAQAYADGMVKAKELDAKEHPLSKTWPEPDYGKLLEGGTQPASVAMARALRDAVPTKPQSAWKLKGWTSRMETLRGFAEDLVGGKMDAATVTEAMKRANLSGVANQAALYEAVGHERSLKGIELEEHSYSLYEGQRYAPPRTIWTVSRSAKGTAFGNWPREMAKGDTREQAIAAFKRRAAELLAEERAPTKGATFEIYGKRAGGAREFYIGKKIGSNVAELKTGFQDIKAARQYLADHQSELEDLLAKYKAVPPVRNAQNAPRIGEDYRKGADVSPEQFQDAFGFRGVQFGNYVEGARRQQDLNRAYDALMDLAGVLGVPPRALSLGGRLGLAFGARGTGGADAAAAHYERGNVVINLTKREGAGSLAHEWWHGLDNYFSRERGDGGSYMTEREQGGQGVREEMRAAFREINRAINQTRMQERSRKLDDRRTAAYWTTKPEMSARAFESYVIAKLQDQNAGNDYLANVLPASAFALEGAYPYPTAGELPQIRGAFDAFFQTVQTRQGDNGATVLYSTNEGAPPARGLSLEEAQQAVQQALAGLRNPPPIDIVSRSEELGVGTPDGVMGAAIPGEGRIVIVASAHASADAVIETVFHETFHLGVRNVLPAADYVQAMLDLAKRDGRVQEYANRWKKEANDAPQQLQALRDQGHTGSELTAQYEALAIEEGLAVVAEELRAQKQAGTRLGLRVRALAGWLASVAERMGMSGLADRIRKMTYNEAERFVLRAIEHAGSAPINPAGAEGARFRTAAQTESPAFRSWFGDSQAVDGAGRPLRVFHGTGSNFSVFSRARAGSVTGAANTGMGFFFSDNADVAGNYARMSRDAQAIMPAYLSVQNPLRLEAKNMLEADRMLMAGLKPEHDGAIISVGMRDGGTHTVFMVREPGQIKSATGNQGTFDPANPDIRYRTGDETPTAERVGNALKAVTVANLKQQAGFKAADYRGLGLQFLGRRQLVDVYGNMLPELRRYSDLMARMDADKNEAGSGADQLAQDWAKLPDERALAELMHDATLAQIDPSRDFVEGDNKTDWTRLQARYNALTPGAQDVFARARDTYRQHMRDVRSAIKERIERTEISSERKAAMLKRMDDEFFGHIKGVYFPLARFGQYVVVVKDADGKVANVSRAETMAEADATRRQLASAFPAAKGFTVGKVLKAKDFVADRDSVGRGFMEQLYGVLDKQGMDAKQRAELEDALGQLYLSSLPDLSWAKHGIHRKGTPGYSQDARRAFAQNVFHGASYLAKLRYGDRLQDELGEMQRRVDAGSTDPAFDSVKAQQVVDEMVKRHDAAMNPKTNAVSTALTSLGFMFHLGLSPASAMVNVTQTALVAYPVMGAKWGFKKASAALLKASGEAARGKNDITASLNPDEKAAFDEAVRHGVIDVTMAHDLAGIAQGEDRNVSYKLRPLMKWASFMFHHAEKFNRQVTFVAAYRLAREAGAGEKAAFAQAVQATYDGHFDYSANNRPRVMQGNVARVLLLFKQYGQNMVYTLARNAHQALKGATPEDRAQARKALGGLLTMHGLAAGALGLPMVTTLLAAASMLGGDDDEPWDAQVALQNMLADTFGQKPAEVLAHGLSRLTPWDISGRVGLDKLIFPDVQEGLEGQRLAESAMSAALGPVAGIGINALKGTQLMGEGQYLRGLESMAPSVLRGPLKSFRYGTEGVRDKTGIVVQDEVGAAELLGQVAGFSPSSVRNAYEGKAAVVQHDRALQARRSALVEQFAMAAMAGDEEGKAEAREAIAKFNEKNPNRRIQAMQLAQSVNQRQKRIREAREGVYLPSKRRDAVEAGRFAVPTKVEG